MINIINNFNNCRILVVGDIMIDEYVWGDVDRISPEAPVQVVHVKRETSTLGGAGNVVNNISALKAKISIVGIAGSGLNSDRLIKMFENIGADCNGIIRDENRSTTLKTRIIAANQHVLRIDRESRLQISDSLANKLLKYVEEKISDIDLLIISDYGKGLLTGKVLSGLISIASKNDKISIVDPKGLDFSKYVGASIITPNRKEAAIASGIDIQDRGNLIKAGEKLIETLKLKRLLITCGKDGMMLFEYNKPTLQIQTQAKQVYDVSGAGDTVVAVMGLSLASGASYRDASYLANAAAGIVVGKLGTATISQDELKAALDIDKNIVPGKFQELSRLSSLTDEMRIRGKKIVLTNGCFDLLHAGHIEFLSASKNLADVLIVALDDDKSVQKLKGEGRPVISENERIRIMSALDCVDYVTVFSTEELDKLLKIIRPDILTKGSNYTHDIVTGKGIVESQGGRVSLIPVTEPISSSMIIKKIKKDSEK